MTPERWQQVKQIFQSVLDCPPEERDAFLARACQNDHMLRGEVESLISSYDQAGTQSIEDLAAQVATEVITDDERNLIIGGKIAHYEVLSQLGRGGMGEVYLAQDSRLGRKVALKFLPASLSADDFVYSTPRPPGSGDEAAWSPSLLYTRSRTSGWRAPRR